MAEIIRFRRTRRWTHARDYGVPRGERRGGDGGWVDAARETGPILWAAPLALGVAVFLATSPDLRSGSVPIAAPFSGPVAGASDRENGSFAICGSGARDTCVIDGDTFWYRGEKIRVADINTPEVSSPKCAAEAELGARATRRFAELLNAGAFTLEANPGRSHDKYGRALFVVTRGGASVGGVLVAEGLAEEWKGYRREWC